MLKFISKFTIGAMVSGALAASAWAQAAPAAAPPAWAAGEYDIAAPIPAEKDPAKQLQLIKKWEQQYPTSAYKNERTLMQMKAEVTIAGPGLTSNAGPVLDAAMVAAQDVVDHLDSYFSAAVKPADVPAAAWDGAKKATELQMHQTLAWGHFVKKDNDAVAEAEMKKVLTLDPNQAQISYQLGSVILRQKSLARYPEAFYHIARAVSLGGPTPMDPANKAKASTFLDNAYLGFHGSAQGLSTVKEQAVAAPFPPPGFDILNAQQIQAIAMQNHAQWAKDNPDLALWEQIRDGIKLDPKYFDSLKGAGLPPEGDIKMFKGKVVEQTSPKELHVNVMSQTGDAILKFDNPIKTVDVGADIQFKGAVDAYTPDPYTLTIMISDPATEIAGLPADIFAAPAGAKKPAGTKAAPKAAPKAGAKTTTKKK